MKVVITGATGFVGGALARALVAQGAEVMGIKRPNSLPPSLPITWLNGDVTQPDSLRGLFQDADWVIHAAGMLGQAGVPEAVYHRLHVDGTKNVLQAVMENGRSRVLYISSPGVLGPIEGDPADETAPLAPSNPYERSKAAAEQTALQFADKLPLIIARPEFIYGPGDVHVLGLFKAVQKGLFFYVGNGRFTCHPTFIEDAVAGLLLCLQHGTPGQIYHITGPCPVTFREFGRTIAQAVGVRPPWLAIPKPVAWLGATLLETVAPLIGKTAPLSRTGVAFFSENRRFSWQKAHHELRYAPNFDLEAGVRSTVQWYQENKLL